MRLSLALVVGFSIASQGCRNGMPDAATWQPQTPSGVGANHHAANKGPATVMTPDGMDTPMVSDPVDPQVAWAEPAEVSPASVAVKQASTFPQPSPIQDVGDDENSLLQPAEPLDLQQPEVIQTPLPQPVVPGPADISDGTDTADDGDDQGSDSTEENATQPLYLADVVASVRNAYPKVREAIARQAEASGEIVSAWGNFDTLLDGETINQPLAFYENYRHAMGVKQPLWNGGYVGAGYRLGRGEFEPWYQERVTNEGGEFKVGVDLPILQNRAIDKRRVAVRSAELRRGQTDPELFREILMAQGDAAFAYWTWVASGLNVEIQRALLQLARDRVEQFETQIAEGDIAEFRKIDNDRLIAAREIKLIDSERKFGESAVKLSMYLRDDNGMPLLPPPDAVPEEFPPIPEEPINQVRLVNEAVRARPETRILQFDVEMLRVELAQANNQLLPELNVVVETSQDVGALSSSKGDKQPAEIEAGFYGEVPLQRRMARGKIESLLAKLRQVEAKLQFARDAIATEVQQILVARDAAMRQIEQAEINLELARETLRIGQFGLQEGEFTLPILNIYEQALADAEAALLVSKADFFIADSLLRIAIGLELDVNGDITPPAAVAP